MDGRPQRKVADYLILSFGVRHLDTITTAGAVKHLAEDTAHTRVLLENIDLSVKAHDSRQIAVVAHHDCAGNPVSTDTQHRQLIKSRARIAGLYPDADVAAIWLDEHWIVERIRAT